MDADRKTALEGFLQQFFPRDYAQRLQTWADSTAGLSTPKLIVACTELRATLKVKPTPGHIFEYAEKRGDGTTAQAAREDVSLAEMQSAARSWCSINGIQPTPENVMRRVRSRIGFRESVVDGRTIRINHPLAPLSAQGWQDAVDQGVVTHIPKRADAAERATVGQLVALAKAGYGWCDEKRAFVPAGEVIDLDHEAAQAGTPYPPRSMTAGAVAGAHAALQRGELARMERKPSPWARKVERETLVPIAEECPF